jgi:hypothetical protein
MCFNFFIHIFRIRLLFNFIYEMWIFNKTIWLMLRMLDLLWFLYFSIKSLFKFFLVLDTLNYLVTTNLDLSKNVSFKSFCLDLYCFIYHFAQLSISLLKLSIFLKDSLISWCIWLNLILKFIYFSLKLLYFFIILLLILSKLFISLAELLTNFISLINCRISWL